MLAAINQQHRAGHCPRLGQPDHCIGNLFGPAGGTQRRHGVGFLKLGLGLIGRSQRNSGCNCHNPQYGCQGGRAEPSGLEQCGLGHGVRKKIRIRIHEFLIKKMDDNACRILSVLMAWCKKRMQVAGQQNRCDEIYLGVGLQKGRTRSLGPIELKLRGVVDNAGQPRETPDDTIKELSDGLGGFEIRLKTGGCPVLLCQRLCQILGSGLGVSVVDGDIPAAGRHCLRDGFA